MEKAKNKTHSFGAKHGQALIEMAIFGAMFILILSALVSYGFKYDAQQSIMMTAFRRAARLASANDPDGLPIGGGSYSMSKETYIPDVNDMFGVGGSAPAAATGSITRDPRLDLAADDGSGLPVMVLDMRLNRDSSGQEQWVRYVHRTSGFRTEKNVDQNMLKKYKIVYGEGALTAQGPVDEDHPSGYYGITDANLKDKIVRECCPASLPCSPKELAKCSKYIIQEIRILDSCSGNVVEYGSCFKQAKKLVSLDYCISQCNLTKVPGSGTKCDQLCSKVTNPPNQVYGAAFNPSLGGAWYADGWYTENCKMPDGTPLGITCWRFPVLEQLFAFGAGNVPEAKSMLAQSDGTVTENARTQTMRTVETPDARRTEEYVKWGDDADGHKSYVYRDSLDEITGQEYPHATAMDYANVITDILPTQSYSGEVNETMETQK